MENKELLEYLKDAIDQETAIAQQEQMIAEYHKLSLQRKPVQQEVRMPAPPMQAVWEWTTAHIVLSITCGIVALLLFIIGVVLISDADYDIDRAYEMMERYPSSAQRHQAELAAAKERKSTATGIVVCGLISAGGCAAVLLHGARQKSKAEQEYLQIINAFNQTCHEVNQRNQEYADEYEQAMASWKSSNDQVYAHMARPLAESQMLLFQFYAADKIYAKYRTLPALTSIYEYFITGRCTELTGPHGAYNMYEDEVRKDTVISQLNTVIENLEQIKQNQYMLYQQVQSINENTQRIAYELRQIKGYTVQIAQLTALNAYYAALNERNTRITMYYHL